MAKRYWLFKSEPTTYSVDDLAKEPDKTDYWDGVRNYQARNMLRDDVKNGDEVLFYHSKTKVPGIVGICSVVRAGYPDTAAFDPDSKYFDPKSSPDNPRWYRVDVKLRKKLPEIISLADLKAMPGLENMAVTQKGSRLSIQPVTPDEWKVIMARVKGMK